MYYIYKKSRGQGNRPYAGATLSLAGIRPALYVNREDAERDAETLTKLNAVGFGVAEKYFEEKE